MKINLSREWYESRITSEDDCEISVGSEKMRDPSRIPKILNKLRLLWEKYPDLRLGQLVENARCSQSVKVDTFNIEDDALEEGLDTWAFRMLICETPDKSPQDDAIEAKS